MLLCIHKEIVGIQRSIRHLLYAAAICATVGALTGCSYVTPNLRVTTKNSEAIKIPAGNATSPTTSSTSESFEGPAYLTTFRSCFSPPSRVPTAEARTRQLFVGWADVMLHDSIGFDSGWEGFTVSGELDSVPLVAIAISKREAEPGCIKELVAFIPNTLVSESGWVKSALHKHVEEYLVHATPSLDAQGAKSQ